MQALQKSGVPFRQAPSGEYYSSLAARIPELQERLSDLQTLSILADGSGSAYLLQIYSQHVVGPFFYEIIQRKGAEGFGESNFSAIAPEVDAAPTESAP